MGTPVVYDANQRLPVLRGIGVTRTESRWHRLAPASIGCEAQLASERPGVGWVPSAAQWAVEQFGALDLGDRRLNQRAVAMAEKMAAHPEASLPQQMANRTDLVGAYRLLNNERVTLAGLLAPHIQQTLAAAGQVEVALLVEDTSELDYTAHGSKTGLGPVGNEYGQGLLLHSTLAVLPEPRTVLGLAHVQVVVRQPLAKPNRHRRHTPEGQVWQVSANQVGRPPAGVRWVHVSDRESDIFAYMATCLDLGKHFLVRAYQNRALVWDAEVVPIDGGPPGLLLDYARRLPAQAEGGYTVAVPATKTQAARQAQVVLQWAPLKLQPGSHDTPAMRRHAPFRVWLLRVWEPAPPAGAEPVEWLLLSDLPITNVADAHRAVDWYTCRWLCEDYHQCLKTGCRIEHSQLDAAADIQRLLGFVAPIAVRLLQLRQQVRVLPEVPAVQVLDPMMVQILARRYALEGPTLSLGQFFRHVAMLGGYQGRKSDGPPGWRTLWKGWRHLSDLTEGAHLLVGDRSKQNESSV